MQTRLSQPPYTCEKVENAATRGPKETSGRCRVRASRGIMQSVDSIQACSHRPLKSQGQQTSLTAILNNLPAPVTLHRCGVVFLCLGTSPDVHAMDRKWYNSKRWSRRLPATEKEVTVGSRGGRFRDGGGHVMLSRILSIEGQKEEKEALGTSTGCVSCPQLWTIKLQKGRLGFFMAGRILRLQGQGAS